MNSLPLFSLGQIELALRLIAFAQFLLALLNLGLPRLLHWQPDLDRMSLLVREVFRIHAWFISLTVAIWAILTWHFAPELARGSTELARWLSAAIGIFWGLRCLLQWTHYSRSHWRGNPARTAIHWALFLGYGAWALVYGVAFRQGTP